MNLELLFKAGMHRGSIQDPTDNTTGLGVMAKGRSGKWHHNRLARKHGCIELFSGLRMGPSWTPTFLQPTDEGTRGSSSGLPKQIVPLSPPRFVVYVLGMASIPSLCAYYFPTTSKIVLCNWDLSLPRGRGRLGAALANGGCRGVLVAFPKGDIAEVLAHKLRVVLHFQ